MQKDVIFLKEQSEAALFNGAYTAEWGKEEVKACLLASVHAYVQIKSKGKNLNLIKGWDRCFHRV